MKSRITIVVLSIVVSALLLGTNVFTNSNVIAKASTLSSKGGNFNDNFNDGIIGSAWNSLATGASLVYEANGVLNMNLAAGPSDAFGSNQVVNVDTKEEILNGDFDVKVDFKVDPAFNTIPDVAAYVSVEVIRGEGGKEREGVRIGIVSGNGKDCAAAAYSSEQTYMSLSGGGAYDYKQTCTSDALGKLRIKRVGNKITTYYWNNLNNSWVQHYSATLGNLPNNVGVKASDNLEIRLDTWNSSPYYSNFWVKWDNLISHYKGN